MKCKESPPFKIESVPFKIEFSPFKIESGALIEDIYCFRWELSAFKFAFYALNVLLANSGILLLMDKLRSNWLYPRSNV